MTTEQLAEIAYDACNAARHSKLRGGPGVTVRIPKFKECHIGIQQGWIAGIRAVLGAQEAEWKLKAKKEWNKAHPAV